MQRKKNRESHGVVVGASKHMREQQSKGTIFDIQRLHKCSQLNNYFPVGYLADAQRLARDGLMKSGDFALRELNPRFRGHSAKYYQVLSHGCIIILSPCGRGVHAAWECEGFAQEL